MWTPKEPLQADALANAHFFKLQTEYVDSET